MGDLETGDVEMTTETILTGGTYRRLMPQFGFHPDNPTNNNVVDFARAIEQAVLQSPEIQALRKDAAMLDWFISQEAQMQAMNRLPSSNVMYRVGWPDDGEYMVEWHSCPRAAINAAMEQQT